MSSPRYRPNVAAIIQTAEQKILIGERSDVPGAWQFPQGGVRKDESALEALFRELREEISLRPSHYRVLDCKGPYRYLFPQGRKKEGFDGQEQFYFFVRLTAPASYVQVETDDPEFSRIRWIEPVDFRLHWVPEFKREVYRQVLLDFFGIRSESLKSKIDRK
jgi:putative (di)nucleoside polyphosphate hydrolase